MVVTQGILLQGQSVVTPVSKYARRRTSSRGWLSRGKAGSYHAKNRLHGTMHSSLPRAERWNEGAEGRVA